MQQNATRNPGIPRQTRRDNILLGQLSLRNDQRENTPSLSRQQKYTQRRTSHWTRSGVRFFRRTGQCLNNAQHLTWFCPVPFWEQCHCHPRSLTQGEKKRGVIASLRTRTRAASPEFLSENRCWRTGDKNALKRTLPGKWSHVVAVVRVRPRASSIG